MSTWTNKCFSQSERVMSRAPRVGTEWMVSMTTMSKRKEFTPHEKYMHKSSVLLQRESKKIRVFLVRKALQQLKQAREQLAAATTAANDVDDDDERKQKRKAGKVKKLTAQVNKLEREHALLKTLDLKQVVAKAFEQTRLVADEPEEESDDEEDEENARRGYDNGEEDDGFNSEDYDDTPMPSTRASDEEEESESESEAESEAEKDGDDEEEDAEKMETEDEEVVHEPATKAEAEAPKSAEEEADSATIAQLVDRVLAHNQMKPFLDAIRQYVEKKEREDAKKARLREKKALKRGQQNLIGGRSARAPTSMFFGSLSGGPDDDDGMDAGNGGYGRMAGAEDDIADFLGETKKKKNRPGQMARRQKAMRQEESLRRQQDRANGVKRRYHDRDAELSKYGPSASLLGPSASKYGPSARPKKAKPTENKSSGNRRDKFDGQKKPWQQSSSRDKPASHDDRRARPESSAPKRPAAPPQRKPEVEPSHPSWLAKQAMKEKQKVSINAFAGKKISFGDD